MLRSEVVKSLKGVVVVDNSLGRVDVEGLQWMRAYESVLEEGGGGKAVDQSGLRADDIVNIQFTSGTTSMPKAACLSHRSILNNGKLIGVSERLRWR